MLLDAGDSDYAKWMRSGRHPANMGVDRVRSTAARCGGYNGRMPHPEYERPAEIDGAVLAAYTNTFIGRSDCYPVQCADGRYRAVYQPLTLAKVEAHVRGQMTLGAYALNTQHQARWLCLDADTDSQWAGLGQMAEQLGQEGVTAYLESSRRGGHLWLFTAPLTGSVIRRLGKWLLARHGLAGVELYPKQARLVTGPGSQVRLPLGIHRRDGRRHGFVTLAGQPLAPTVRDQLRVLAAPQRLPTEWIEAVLPHLPEAKTVTPTPRFERGTAVGFTLSERLKNAISVRDFVSQFVVLDQANTGLCPFHDDQVNSFSVDEQGNYWQCFAGCGGGSLIDFWMQWRQAHGQDSSFTATIKDLANLLLS